MRRVDRVYIDSHAYKMCQTHAQLTNQEEVMGLLIGDKYEHDGAYVVHIFGCYQLLRSDKRPDRVEISPKQLSESITELGRINGMHTGLTMKTVGWFHSHPGMTVFPSQVDLNTQGGYETLLDADWIGVIFSVFSRDSDRAGSTQALAFQSLRFNENSKQSTIDTDAALAQSIADGMTDEQVVEHLAQQQQEQTSAMTGVDHQTQRFHRLPLIIIPASKPTGNVPPNLSYTLLIDSLQRVLKLISEELFHEFNEKNTGVQIVDVGDASSLQRPRQSSNAVLQLTNANRLSSDVCSILSCVGSPLLVFIHQQLLQQGEQGGDFQQQRDVYTKLMS